MNRRRQNIQSLFTFVLGIVATIITAYGLIHILRSKLSLPRGLRFKLSVSGLTADEVVARQTAVGVDALVEAEQKRFLRHAIRRNLFSTFNIDLIAIAIVMLLLGSPLSALGTLAILAFNLVLNVYQETYTKRRLDKLVWSLRPQTAVIRDGQLKSVDSLNLVLGDMVTVSEGDQIIADGRIIMAYGVDGSDTIVVDDSVGEQQQQSIKKQGDRVQAGTICVNGRAVYQVNHIDKAQLATNNGVQLLSTQLTPLQQLIENILRTLFVLVVVFSIVLIADAMVQQVTLVSQVYRDAFGLVFGIAPTSLFFVLIVNYAIGSLRMSDFGALIFRSQSIESLANVSVLCLSHRSLLSGVQVTVDPISPTEGSEQEVLSDTLARHILGDVVHSMPLHNRASQMLADTISGDKRTAVDIAPFLFMFGWYGVSFDDEDRRGTFVLGETAVLEKALLKEKGNIRAEVEKKFDEAGQWLRDTSAQMKTTPADDGDETETLTIWQRLGKRMQALTDPLDDTATISESEALGERIALTLAYLPEIVPLTGGDNQPHLPADLILLAHIAVAETILPEARDTIQAFLAASIEVKLLASNDPQWAAVTARALGLDDKSLSGAELAGLSKDAFDKVVRETAVFGHLIPAQKAAVVKSLQEQGAYVAMVGDGADDVAAMRHADLRIALKSASQAALKNSDIALLQNSLVGLPVVLKTGQRLVNGVLSTFKLYLSQVTAQLLLIITVFILGLSQFPYHPTQGGVIAVFTITIPNILLAFWASPGQIGQDKMQRKLAHFIIPTAITFAVLALSVYFLFMQSNGDQIYAQLAVTYALLAAGWITILFVQPPTKFWVGGEKLAGDKRVFGLVAASIVVYIVILLLPLLPGWLRIDFLRSLTDYVWVATAVIVWTLALRTIWRMNLLNWLVEMVAGRFN